MITEKDAIKFLIDIKNYDKNEINEDIEYYGNIWDIITGEDLLVDFAEYLGMKVYFDRESYLQLHDNHTFYSITNNDNFDFVYKTVVKDAIRQFEIMFDESIYLLGRSGRHVCVKLSIDNIKNFDKMRKYALKLEQNVINQINEWTPER